ncbi:transposase [Flavihumibacter stibioxidans]|uniref:Transposase IS200-like domain-containing protein n=1 Tax=Flavihumibacter stibioxidans TaxID=1834163 RepID=A0ABR7M7P9_9BACT|nr:transposase [Flavihumibacter stibioxidans]MBC6491075.1 hypothetical protein [Flavihumibacter stibioxidans]
MKPQEGQIYHIYNRGNQKQTLFFNDSNYYYFLKKMKDHLLPYVDLLSWTLMPNHYHFEIYANEKTVQLIDNRIIPISCLSEGMRNLQSSYTAGFNAQYDKSGNLFHQKFKNKLVGPDTKTQGRNLLHYIHRNAFEAGLVNRIQDWKFSSYNEYLIPERPGFCNKELAMQLLDLDRRSILQANIDPTDFPALPV